LDETSDFVDIDVGGVGAFGGGSGRAEHYLDGDSLPDSGNESGSSCPIPPDFLEGVGRAGGRLVDDEHSGGVHPAFSSDRSHGDSDSELFS
jgi:hypothetical protein